MIDDFALGITQLLILVTVWRLLRRTDLDVDAAGGPAPAKAAAPLAHAPATAALSLVPSLFGPSPYGPAAQGERQP